MSTGTGAWRTTFSATLPIRRCARPLRPAVAITTESTSRATNDAYTGMLTISLLALIGGSILLFLDYNQYGERHPPKVPDKAMILAKPEAPSCQLKVTVVPATLAAPSACPAEGAVAIWPGRR